MLYQIVRDCKAGKSAVKNVTFLWVVRTTGASAVVSYLQLFSINI